MNELQPLIDLISAKHGWVSAIPVWIGGIMTLSRILVKPFNSKLQDSLTGVIANAAKNKEDAQWWHDRVLSKGWYRAGAFFSDLILSVKLPSHADFHELTKSLQ